MTGLHLSSVLAATTLDVDLVKVLLESLLSLQTGYITSCKLVFDNTVLRDHCLVHLTTVLPLLTLLCIELG